MNFVHLVAKYFITRNTGCSENGIVKYNFKQVNQISGTELLSNIAN
jgi:hypothetical protein